MVVFARCDVKPHRAHLMILRPEEERLIDAELIRRVTERRPAPSPAGYRMRLNQDIDSSAATMASAAPMATKTAVTSVACPFPTASLALR